MQPNILLITTDEQRWDALGINHPGAIQTPFLDSLAASGTNFTRAYSTCPLCIPARRTLLSGLHPAHHQTIVNTEGEDFTPPATIPQLVREQGYQTQLIGKLHVGIPGKRYGFDHIIQSETPNDRRLMPHQWRNDYADWLDRALPGQHPLGLGVMSNDRMARPYHLPEQFHHNHWATEQAVQFLGTYRDPSQPFYLHLSYWAPHQPLIPPQAYWERYRDNTHHPVLGEWTTREAWKPGRPPSSPGGPFRLEEIRQAIAGYYGLINHIDDQLNYLFDRWSCSRLKSDRPLLILFTSDHGDLMGDHHLFRKHQPYEGSAHVPLFMAGRHGYQIPKGSSEALVSLEDVAATVLDASGAARPSHFRDDDGWSLLRQLKEEKPFRSCIHGQGYSKSRGSRHHRFLVMGPWKYIRFTSTGEEQLFHLERDPGERRDVSAEEDLTEFRTRMNQHRDTSPPGVDWESTVELRPSANQPPQAVWG